MDGKQFAEAPESSAAWMVLVELVLLGPKVTFFVALLTGLTCSALLVFKIDVGVLVDLVDRDDTDDPLVVMVGACVGCFCNWFKQKPGQCASL